MILNKPHAWQRVWPRLLGMFGVALVGVCAWPYTVDDSYIVARYALRLSRGEGYTWNPGPATDGVTGPAWLVPGWLAAAGGYDPVIAAKVVGLCCAALAAYICIAAQQTRARGTQLAWIAGFLLVCQPSVGGSGSSGLETGAATLALTCAAQAALATPKPSIASLGGAIALLAWLRPELAASCAVFLTIATVRAGFRRAWGAWVIAACSALAVCLFRWRISGSFLPMAWHAKAGTLQDGWAYALRAVAVLTGMTGMALAAAGVALGQFRERARAWALLAHFGAVVLAGGDWMPGFRLWVPLFPQYAALAAVGSEHLWRRGGIARWLGTGAFLVACGVPLLDLALRIPEWRNAGKSRETVGAAIARELRGHEERVALVDIGYIGYASGATTIDLAGLTDPAVAAFPGGHLAKRITPEWLEAQAPDALLLHSSLPPTAAADGRLERLAGYPVEMRVARFSWVAKQFRVAAIYPYGPGYHYVLLRRLSNIPAAATR
ncbi:MAG TPA: hypothetical protein VFN67_40365 [Polyangiales bacterium]|nr:hypothetical protein [Polyangiales bacterium]